MLQSSVRSGESLSSGDRNTCVGQIDAASAIMLLSTQRLIGLIRPQTRQSGQSRLPLRGVRKAIAFFGPLAIAAVLDATSYAAIGARVILGHLAGFCSEPWHSSQLSSTCASAATGCHGRHPRPSTQRGVAAVTRDDGRRRSYWRRAPGTGLRNHGAGYGAGDVKHRLPHDIEARTRRMGDQPRADRVQRCHFGRMASRAGQHGWARVGTCHRRRPGFARGC